jgi:hypothetical protein
MGDGVLGMIVVSLVKKVIKRELVVILYQKMVDLDVLAVLFKVVTLVVAQVCIHFQYLWHICQIA